jgi:uncharacterized membrane protein
MSPQSAWDRQPLRHWGEHVSERRGGSRELPLGRLEAFSDGVFAIAITLLVLELGVRAGSGENLLGAILGEWPAYLAYVTSFLTIGVFWLHHSALTSALRAADGVLYRINLLVLLLVSFLPFPTKLISEYIADRDAERIAAVFYGLVLLMLDLAMTALGRYALEGRRFVREEVDPAVTDAAMTHAPSLVFYGLAIGLAIIVPIAAVVLYLLIAIYLGIPGRTIHRLLRSWRPGSRSGP